MTQALAVAVRGPRGPTAVLCFYASSKIPGINVYSFEGQPSPTVTGLRSKPGCVAWSPELGRSALRGKSRAVLLSVPSDRRRERTWPGGRELVPILQEGRLPFIAPRLHGRRPARVHLVLPSDTLGMWVPVPRFYS